MSRHGAMYQDIIPFTSRYYDQGKFGRLFPSLPPFAANTQKVKDALKDMGKKGGIMDANANPSSKIYLGQNAAKLLLSRVYITRRAAGDAQLAIQLADEVIAAGVAQGATNPSFSTDAATTVAAYAAYFSGSNDAIAENHAETVWELELNSTNDDVTGIGVNIALPAY